MPPGKKGPGKKGKDAPKLTSASAGTQVWSSSQTPSIKTIAAYVVNMNVPPPEIASLSQEQKNLLDKILNNKITEVYIENIDTRPEVQGNMKTYIEPPGGSAPQHTQSGFRTAFGTLTLSADNKPDAQRKLKWKDQTYTGSNSFIAINANNFKQDSQRKLFGVEGKWEGMPSTKPGRKAQLMTAGELIVLLNSLKVADFHYGTGTPPEACTHFQYYIFKMLVEAKLVEFSEPVPQTYGLSELPKFDLGEDTPSLRTLGMFRRYWCKKGGSEVFSHPMQEGRFHYGPPSGGTIRSVIDRAPSYSQGQEKIVLTQAVQKELAQLAASCKDFNWPGTPTPTPSPEPESLLTDLQTPATMNIAPGTLGGRLPAKKGSDAVGREAVTEDESNVDANSHEYADETDLGGAYAEHDADPESAHLNGSYSPYDHTEGHWDEGDAHGHEMEPDCHWEEEDHDHVHPDSEHGYENFQDLDHDRHYDHDYQEQLEGHDGEEEVHDEHHFEGHEHHWDAQDEDQHESYYDHDGEGHEDHTSHDHDTAWNHHHTSAEDEGHEHGEVYEEYDSGHHYEHQHHVSVSA